MRVLLGVCVNNCVRLGVLVLLGPRDALLVCVGLIVSVDRTCVCVIDGDWLIEGV